MPSRRGRGKCKLGDAASPRAEKLLQPLVAAMPFATRAEIKSIGRQQAERAFDFGHILTFRASDVILKE